MFDKALALVLLSALFVSACGGGGGGDDDTTTEIQVFDGAATGCSVTVNGVAATELGDGAYSFDGSIDDGVILRATGCTDSDTGLLLPAMSGVAQSGGGVISPITTLIVESLLASDPTASRLPNDEVLNAVNQIITNLGLVGYDPIDPSTANYVAAAKADVGGTGISANAMRVALAISTLLKGAEVAAGSTDASAAVTAIAKAVSGSTGIIVLSNSTAVEALLNNARALASTRVGAALTVAGTAVAPSIVVIIVSPGNITDAISVTTAISKILNDADETAIATPGFSTQLLTVAVAATDNTTPVASDDVYNAFGNTLLEVGVTASGNIATKVSGSVLNNDSDLDAGAVLTASLETQPVSGGSVSMNADGNFSYEPAAGQTAFVDSFTYRVSDGATSAIGTVSINVSERIWYVDNHSSSGFGTSNDPFASLAEAQLVAVDGDRIYIAYGDGTTLGLDNGLTLAVPNVTLTGEGTALIVGSTTLAGAGNAPTITNASGDGITLNSADNTRIAGINVSDVLGDGIVIGDSTGIVIEAATISNSGKSAIQGAGADIELFLTDVIIENVDVVDPSISDDAIFMAPTASVSLVMSGGSIDGVPGSLGDGIVLRNENSANVVSMNLDVTAVQFINIAQDGIKLDNDNGLITAQIGGPTLAEGNVFNVGFRGIQIQTDADPTMDRTNRIMVQNNTIASAKESIQIRHINDKTNLSILDNVVSRPTQITSGAIIDVQSEDSATTQARINRNDINLPGGEW